MKISEIMAINPVIVDPETPVKEIARLMRERSIGSVVLVRENRPVGIVTERDLVHRVMAPGADPASLRAWDVCSRPVVAISQLGDVDDACDMMREYGIRRLVVVDDRDGVVGVLTTDDIGFNLRSMSEELAVKYLIMMRRSAGVR
jgi:CBS domain-containing protein